ncbi:hypothetical protein J2T20_002123 [Paenibacillus wynnii]|nr:hypothetical protein [Paenibacillus wynnii]
MGIISIDSIILLLPLLKKPVKVTLCSFPVVFVTGYSDTVFLTSTRTGRFPGYLHHSYNF